MDLIKNLAFFTRVVEKGGVAAAGREFGMSSATASDRLAALEAHYGVVLINRTTRTVNLTEEGRILVERARHLVADAQDIEVRLRNGIDQISGLIRVSATIDFGSQHLSPLIDEFIEAHPDIRIELLLTDKHVDLYENGIDLALRFGALQGSALMMRKLGENQRAIVASPSYLKAHGTPMCPDDLQHHNCIVIRLGSDTDEAWAFNSRGKRKIVQISGNLICNNGMQVREWCLKGRGIARKSIWDVHNDIVDGRLVRLLMDYQSLDASALQIVYPSATTPPKRVTRLIDFLEQNLQQHFST